MFKTPSDAVATAKALKVKLVNVHNVDVVLCPPAIDIVPVQDIVKDSQIKLGGQNIHWEEEGAFTGETSGPMLLDAGCQYVVLGHSERRHVFGETDVDINKKVRKAVALGLKPIFCIGETLDQRNADQTEKVVAAQMRAGLEAVEIASAQDLVIAYEPVWAIGTGVNATPEQAEEVHALVRGILAEKFGNNLAQELCIQYGGSVKPANAKELLSKENVDGALVGGASLDAESFSAIIKIAEEI